MSSSSDESREWLETDGLGGFASGTVARVRTRRYHALLQVARTPPTGRCVLVNGVEAWVETEGVRRFLSRQRYEGGVMHPDGPDQVERFEAEPWPRWTFRLPDGRTVVHEVFVPEGRPAVALSWRIEGAGPPAALCVRPLLSGRDHHALHVENPSFRFETASSDGALAWAPYEGVPAVAALANGAWSAEPLWYRSFLYAEERARGYPAVEDLAAPGLFRFDLDAGEAALLLAAPSVSPEPLVLGGDAAATLAAWRRTEAARRRALGTRLDRAAGAYLVRRGTGRSLIAGYPWFTDWGRDTFIALRGLCLATGRLDEALDILGQWAETIADGLLPNRFADQGEGLERNTVDASLWYAVAVHETLAAFDAAGRTVPSARRRLLRNAVERILSGFASGTRHGIRVDEDGLVAAGEQGLQLTWMDAKVGDRVVTPRIGKPVEVQALWLNALHLFAGASPRWRALFERGLASFRRRFLDPARGTLYDVVDDGHVPGAVDAALRPNQILAVGGLPLALLEGEDARRVVDAVESVLWTPLGLRTLAPGSPGYAPRYEGDLAARDLAYHQGTAWPWLLGPFVEAWVRVRGGTAAARKEARRRFLAPLVAHLDEAGLGHVSEIADAEPPHTPRGAPFQAWSLGELLRLDRVVLSGSAVPRPRRPRRPAARGRLEGRR